MENEEKPQAEETAVENDLQELIRQLTQERDALQEQVLRTMADFQNFRRRTQQEAATLRQYATENFVTALLPVLDNFERTVDHVEKGANMDSLLEGVRAVERQLRSVIEGQNVTRIESMGQPFDPNLHEAIGVEPAEGIAENTVMLEVEPGYRMGDKVIRPARVKVAGS